jgi:outer membrane protein OmpA-like peptidoglycan-associated protein
MKKHITACFLLLSAFVVRSQDFLGYVTSNYSGITGVYLNPANVVESRMKVDVNLVGLNFAAANNYVGIKRSAFVHSGKLSKGLKNQSLFDPKSTDPNAIYYPAFSDPSFQRNYLTTIDNGKEKAIYVALRVAGPSFLVNLNRKNAIGVTTSMRTYMNVDGISQELATLIYNDFGAGSVNDPNYLSAQNLVNKRLKVDYLRATAMSWMEYGLTYGHVFRDKDEHYIKAGGTVKLLQGLVSAYVNAKNIDFQFDTSQIVSKQKLTISNTTINYGHSSNLEFPSGNVSTEDSAFFNPETGDPTLKYTLTNGYPKFATYPGWGLDLGVVYEWRPHYRDYIYEMDGDTGLWRKDKNKYKLKVGASIVDIGFIRYAKGRLSNNILIDTTFDFRKIDTTGSKYPVNGFDKSLRGLAKYQNEKASYTVGLPLALSFQIDYNIWKDFYINLTPYIAFRFKNKEAKVHDWTNISLSPRWDHRWFGVSVPISYNSFSAKNDQPMRVGACVRLGPLIVGTNNIGAYKGKKDFFGADLYMMLRVPIPYHGPRDKDKDKVSNKKDKCKEVPGVWEFKGCPDRDGDHVQDSEDKCPDTPGLKELAGCPDKDGDGITDAEDACPDDKGLLEFKGCPDRDGDKIIDKDDECPDDAGLAEFMGCPDKDVDGTPDKLDACPDVPGPKEFKGCPDRDGDTVLDKDDGCPEVAGPVENKGCPWPDTDKDGIVDKDDACPTISGLAQYKGCPPPPPIKPAEQKIIERAFKSLEFATGKDIIVKKSLPSLNELAKLLVQHKNDWTLKLSGHTDNQGSAESNMILSEKRAKAVKKYLVSKGVSEDRVITEWFGQTQPIDTNATPKGRQKNRRVEMKILFAEPK